MYINKQTYRLLSDILWFLSSATSAWDSWDRLSRNRLLDSCLVQLLVIELLSYLSLIRFQTSEEEEEFSSSERRRYKAYTVMQKAGFQHTESVVQLLISTDLNLYRYAQIMVHLCRAEILISLIFLAHGTTCPGYPNEAEYQSTCHMNTVSAIVSLLTGAMGLGAVHRYRWRTMLILWLVFCIMSSVGSLLAVITTGKNYFKIPVWILNFFQESGSTTTPKWRLEPASAMDSPVSCSSPP